MIFKNCFAPSARLQVRIDATHIIYEYFMAISTMDGEMMAARALPSLYNSEIAINWAMSCRRWGDGQSRNCVDDFDNMSYMNKRMALALVGMNLTVLPYTPTLFK